MSKEICPIISKPCIREKCGAYTEGRKNIFGMPVFDKEKIEIIPEKVKFETTGHLWWKKTVEVVVREREERTLKHVIGTAFSIQPSCKLVEDYPFGLGKIELYPESNWRVLRVGEHKDDFWFKYKNRLRNPKEVKMRLGIK